jgi:hypothetical protein
MKDKKIKQLTIDENKWCEGSLYEDGSYCALGYVCKRLGYSDEELDGFCVPTELERSPPTWMSRNLADHEGVKELTEDLDFSGLTDFDDIVPTINDATGIPMDEKKSRLKKVFKMVGIDLHFKNGKR